MTSAARKQLGGSGVIICALTAYLWRNASKNGNGMAKIVVARLLARRRRAWRAAALAAQSCSYRNGGGENETANSVAYVAWRRLEKKKKRMNVTGCAGVSARRRQQPHIEKWRRHQAAATARTLAKQSAARHFRGGAKATFIASSMRTLLTPARACCALRARRSACAPAERDRAALDGIGV